MREDRRSNCPISTGLEVLGDRWTLLIVRDLMFAGKRHYREFLQSEEGISTNVLADRLETLVARGLVTKSGDESHKQKARYSLTEKGIALLPVILALSGWSQKYFPETRLPGARALLEGGDALRRKLEARLRKEHLG